MDSSTNQVSNRLAELFGELVSLGNLSEEQKQELFTKLEGAIVLNITGKLLDQLSESDRKILEQKQPKTGEDLFNFLSGAISPDDFRKIAGQSMEEVMKKFLDKI